MSGMHDLSDRRRLRAGRCNPDDRPRRSPRELPAAARPTAARCLRCGGQGRWLWARRRRGRCGAARGGLFRPSSSPMLPKALALREALGPEPEIFVLNGLHAGAEDVCAAGHLTAVVNSVEQLAAWRAAAGRAGRQAAGAVQVDSGMSRLGMSPARGRRGGRRSGAFDGLELGLVMSHLACADEPAHPANEAAAAGVRQPARHAAAGACLARQFLRHLSRRRAITTISCGPAPRSTASTRRRAGRTRCCQVVRLQAKVIQTRAARSRRRHRLRPCLPRHGADASWRRSRSAMPTAGRAARQPPPGSTACGCRSLGRVSMDSIILDISAPAGRAADAGRSGRTDRPAPDASTMSRPAPARSATRS